MAYHYQHVASRCITCQDVCVQQSHATKRLPSQYSEPLQICCHVIVTQ